MKIRLAYHFIATFVAILFLGLQTGAIAHDIQPTDISHHQDCVLCHLVTGDETEIALPAKLPVFTPVIRFLDQVEYDETYIVCVLQTPPGRAPPPRGPPLTQI